MSSREESPDWLRCFQAPSTSTLVLSSDSEPSCDGSPSKEDRTDSQEPSLRDSPEDVDDDQNFGKILGATKNSKLKSPVKGKKLSEKPKKRKGDDDGDKKVTPKRRGQRLSHEVLSLSSDSESSPENSPLRKNHTPRGRSSGRKNSEQIGEVKDEAFIDSDDDSPSKKASKERPKGNEPEEDAHPLTNEKKKRDMKREGDGSDVEVAEEEAPEKQVDTRVSSAKVPLMLSEKVHRTKALVECEGDSIDLAGDMGSVGRVVISDTVSGDDEMYLDLKGTIYKTTIVPCRTFCVVSFGQTEAKIEAIMNDFIQLKPQSNVFEAETMVEGTLDGFSFESDEEADKVPKGTSHQTNEDGEAKANGKTKGKAEKTSGVARKRGKTAGGKSQPQKKKKAQSSKKAQPSKKAKTKK